MLIDYDYPKVSIVTIVYNGGSVLERTIKSVINQTYKNIEYIIIDGKSSDSSISVINKYEKWITYWVSEPDNGIYDAMNKGLEKATGEWVNFMNCGDIFYNNNIIGEIFKLKRNADIIYGDNVLMYEWGEIVLAPDELSNMKKHMVFGHQTAFVKREILNKYKFDSKYKISGDYNLFYLLYTNGYIFEYVPACISKIDARDGVSRTRPLITFKEDAVITGRKHNQFWCFLYIGFCIRVIVSGLVTTLLPKKYILRRKERKILKNELIKYIYLI